MIRIRYAASLFALGLVMLGAPTAGWSADKVRVASAFRGFWDTTMVEFGRDKGLFAAEGIDIELTYTTGGSEIIQAVVSGGADVGLATGTMGAMAAVVKGAPVVIASAEFLGSSDLFYYVKADSPIKSFKDLNGKKLGIARPGSSSHSVGAILAANNGIKLDYVATGAPTATFTAVMSGQVDAAWSVFPAMLGELEKGAIRIIGVGRDAAAVNSETTRVNVASKAFADSEVAKRFFRAYKKTIDWAYTSDEAAQKYADISKIGLATAKRVISQDYPKEVLSLAKVGTVELSITEGVENKFLPKAPTADELKQMFRYVSVLNQ